MQVEKVQQVEQPTGLLGHLMGWTMRLMNADMNQAAVKELAPQSDDCILEVGFGPGDAIAQLTHQIHAGFIAGVDHSSTMLAQASHRNAQAICQGLVELHHGTIWDLSYPDATFDKVFAVNSFQFWKPPERALQKIFHLLKHGGMLLIVVRMKNEGSWLDFAGASLGETIVEQAVHSARAAGFREVRTSRRNAYPFPAACVMAHKPNSVSWRS